MLMRCVYVHPGAVYVRDRLFVYAREMDRQSALFGTNSSLVPVHAAAFVPACPRDFRANPAFQVPWGFEYPSENFQPGV